MPVTAEIKQLVESIPTRANDLLFSDAMVYAGTGILESSTVNLSSHSLNPGDLVEITYGGIPYYYLIRRIGSKAVGNLTALATADLSDGDYFILRDGVNLHTTFWIDKSGSFTPTGGYNGWNIRVNISGVMTDIEVATLIRAAVTWAPNLLITCDAALAAIIYFENDNTGTPGNLAITELLAAGSFNPNGMHHGSNTSLTVEELFPFSGSGLICKIRKQNTYIGSELITLYNNRQIDFPSSEKLRLAKTYGDFTTRYYAGHPSDSNFPCVWYSGQAGIGSVISNGGVFDSSSGELNFSVTQWPVPNISNFDKYWVELATPLSDPLVGTRIITGLKITGGRGEIITGLCNSGDWAGLDSGNRLGAGLQIDLEGDGVVRLVGYYQGVSNSVVVPFNANYLPEKLFIFEFEIIGLNRLSVKLWQWGDFENTISNTEVIGTGGSVNYDRWFISSEAGLVSGVAGDNINGVVQYCDIEVGTGAVVDASGGVTEGLSKGRLLYGNSDGVVGGVIRLTSGVGAKAIKGRLGDGIDFGPENSIGLAFDDSEPVVVINSYSFESSVIEQGLVKVSDEDGFDGCSLNFQSDMDGRYYLYVGAPGTENRVLVDNGSVSSGVPVVVNIGVDYLKALGVGDGERVWLVWVESEFGVVGRG